MAEGKDEEEEEEDDDDDPYTLDSKLEGTRFSQNDSKHSLSSICF
jgi:hypothetical protein